MSELAEQAATYAIAVMDRDKQIKALRESVLALAAEVEALRKDAERIDWLATLNGAFYNIDRITSIVGVGFNRLPTLRAAIDAAMKGQ